MLKCLSKAVLGNFYGQLMSTVPFGWLLFVPPVIYLNIPFPGPSLAVPERLLELHRTILGEPVTLFQFAANYDVVVDAMLAEGWTVIKIGA